MLRAVCFDLMDTVIADPYLAAFEAGTGMSLRDAHRIRDPQAWPDFETGAIDEAEFVRRFWLESERGRPFDISAFHTARRGGYAFLPGMDALLDDLRGHVDRYVASNYPAWIDEVAETFVLSTRFEGVYASCTLGVRKPDAAFYEALLGAIGRTPSECLFVDDREVNCVAAEDVGMRAHVFTGADDLRRRLAAEGIPIARTADAETATS